MRNALAQELLAELAVMVVGGPGVAQELLRAGVVDQLRVDVMPVLFGGGLRFLENLDPERVRLEKTAVHDIGPRTSLSFRVVSGTAPDC
jgi:dihydrofolate reductase